MRRAAAATLLALCLAGCSPRGSSPPPPNVVLISVDTLRADRLNAYGYGARPTSPHMDALAADGLLFEVHVAASPWTTPSHLSLLTGLTPTRHGVVGSYGALMQGLAGDGRTERLAEATSTLAEILAAHGWATGAFTGGVTLDPRIGFDQGFEDYDTSMVKLDRGKVERVLEWIDDRRGPFFLFWHTFEAHAPYLDGRFLPEVLPEDRARKVAERLAEIAGKPGWKPVGKGIRTLQRHRAFRQDVVEALYDGGVAAFDFWLGEIVDGLRQRGLYDRTLIVLTSDHGEQLGEAGRPTTAWGKTFYNVHGHTVYEEMIRVPLIVKLPGQEHRGQRITGTTASIDVMSTILDVLGLAVPAEAQGQTLRPLWEGGEWTGREALSEALSGVRREKEPARRALQVRRQHRCRDGPDRGAQPRAGRRPGGAFRSSPRPRGADRPPRRPGRGRGRPPGRGHGGKAAAASGGGGAIGVGHPLPGDPRGARGAGLRRVAAVDAVRAGRPSLARRIMLGRHGQGENMATAPPPPSDTLDFGRCFTFITEDPDWLTKVLAGGLFTLLSVVLVGIPFLLGYWGRTLRNVAAGQPRPLPEWDDLGGIFSDGLRLLGVYLVYTLGLTMGIAALSCVFVAPLVVLGNAGNLDDGPGALVGALGGLGTLLFGAVMVIVGLAALVYLPAAMARAALRESFAEGFAWREVTAFIQANLGNYALALVAYILASFLSQFGVILCCVGIFPAAFWSYEILAYGLGETVRLNPTSAQI